MITQTTQVRRRTRIQRGFSLIELLIVVSVILIIAAIAIPNFIKSRMRANESGAVQNLRSIATANTVYFTTYGIGYSANLTKLGGNLVLVDQDNAGLIDTVLSTGIKSGYSYSYTVTATDTLGHPVGWEATADPITLGTTGERFFFVDHRSVVRYNNGGTATATDPTL